jgi:hypothetical protein
MPGYKGMVPDRARPGVMRLKVWQSMRILKRFTVADLCRTSGAKRNNARKFVQRLVAHGYVAVLPGFVSGRAGSYRSYRLVKDCGPNHPMRCERCGNALGAPCRKGDDDDG